MYKSSGRVNKYLVRNRCKTRVTAWLAFADTPQIPGPRPPLTFAIGKPTLKQALGPSSNKPTKRGFSCGIAGARRALGDPWAIRRHELRPIFRRFEPPGLTVSPTTGGIVTG
jgi:hypothetical protein